MGHFRTEVRGVGKTRREAESAAVADFFHEHGHRHSLREVESAVLVRRVPPKKEVETIRLGTDLYGRTTRTRVITFEDDPDAPPEEWLEEWEFVLHTHA